MALHRRLKFPCRVVVAIAALVSLLFLLAPLCLPVLIDEGGQVFLEHHRCAACFGENLCPDIYRGAGFRLTRWTRFTASKFFNARNVYFGSLNGQQVVAKKLGHDWELQHHLEDNICRLAEKPPKYCNAAHYVKFLATLHAQDALDPAPLSARTLSLDFGRDAAKVLQAGNDYLGCVKSQRLMDHLTLRPQYHRSSMTLENVIALLLVNPEPLALATFPAEEGWPFPVLHGACGRVAFVQDAGRPLSEYLNEPFEKRARLALQVLEIADTLTNKDRHLSLHLTDWSQSNFAVDPRTSRVRLVDLENLVVVNKSLVEEVKAPGWNVAHTSAPRDGYSLEDLCSHAVTDNNVYGACQWILFPHAEVPNRAGVRGLLYNVPQRVRSKHFLLEKLLRECSKPTNPNPGARFEAAKQLKQILAQI